MTAVEDYLDRADARIDVLERRSEDFEDVLLASEALAKQRVKDLEATVDVLLDAMENQNAVLAQHKHRLEVMDDKFKAASEALEVAVRMTHGLE